MGTYRRWYALSEIERYDEGDHIHQMMDKVASRLMQGKSELAIARDLGIKRVEVIKYRDLWRERVQHDMESTDAAREHLNKMVVHYDRLIDKSYRILDDLDALAFDEKVAAQKNTTLKNISEYEKVRVDLLQKAGLLDGNFGDEMAEMEEKQALLISILRDDLCPECRNTVARKLQKVTQVVEATVVHEG